MPSPRRLALVAALAALSLGARAPIAASSPGTAPAPGPAGGPGWPAAHAVSAPMAPPAASDRAGASAPAPASASAASSSARYIVQLATEPIAAAARTDGSGTLGSATGPVRLDMSSAAAAARAREVDAAQERFAAALAVVAPGARPLQRYRVAFDGVAVRLTTDQAAAAARLPGVVAVTREEPVVWHMDASLGQIEAPSAWTAVGGRDRAGLGVRIAIIDTGISADHPMFAREDLPMPAGFPRAALTVGDAVTPYEAGLYTSRKVIVARAYANPETYDPARPVTPLATLYHGAHVAGIAAGGVVTAAVPSGLPVEVSGVAPGAHLMSYKIADAYTPELLRAIDDAVADGADVINCSWGTSAMNVVDPRSHPISVALRNATAAGAVVVAAAGNGGSGEATLGGPFQMIDEVIAVGAVRTGRTLADVVLASDADLPPELVVHPSTTVDFGARFDVLTGPAVVSDLCSPLEALRARDKVVLVAHDAACETSLVPLPITLPAQLRFVQSLLTAGFVGARAVVLYAPTEQDAALRVAALQAFEAVLPALAAQLGDVKMPVTAIIGGPRAVELVEWSRAHATLRLTVSRDPVPVPAPELADTSEPTSSRGPAPDGSGSAVKPDLVAPGVGIRSAGTDAQGAPDGLIVASGTSMASPHVAGAAAVLRAAWPAWSPAEVRAALLGTARPVATDAGETAGVGVQGAGRLDLAGAVDPGVLALPPTVDLGVRPAGAAPTRVSISLRDVRRDASGPASYRLRVEPEPGAADAAPVTPDRIEVPVGGQARLELSFAAPDLPPGTYGGRVVLEGGGHVVRVTYAFRVPEAARDVLLVDVRLASRGAGGFGRPQLVDVPGRTDLVARALGDAGLSYDVWSIASDAHDGLAPLSVLRRYGFVIVAAGDGDAPLELTAGGMTGLQAYLLGGGRVLTAGPEWDHGPASAAKAVGSQVNGLTYHLSRYFAGFDRTADDVPNPGDLRPVRLFGGPVALSAVAGDDVAGNGDRLDAGRPLARLQTVAGPRELLPLDQGFAAPVAVEMVMPYARSYLELPDGRSAMTGVDADATLELPRRADHISWRALHAGFALEAVATRDGHVTRAELLRRAWEWAVEPADLDLRLAGPRTVAVGAQAVMRATAESQSGVAAVRWRWDAGDGRPFGSEDGSSARLAWSAPGTYLVRVEATTAAGHTYVADAPVRVGGIYLPLAAARRR